MRRAVAATLLGLSLATPAAAQTADRTQPSGVQQMLKGLLSGNQDQDRALRDAYERGYERGRQDEARRLRSERYSRSSEDRYSDEDRQRYQDDRRIGERYRQPGNDDYSR